MRTIDYFSVALVPGKKVLAYTTLGCGCCSNTHQLLDSKSVEKALVSAVEQSTNQLRHREQLLEAFRVGGEAAVIEMINQKAATCNTE